MKLVREMPLAKIKTRPSSEALIQGYDGGVAGLTFHSYRNVWPFSIKIVKKGDQGCKVEAQFRRAA